MDYKLLYQEARRTTPLDRFDSSISPGKVNTMASIKEYASLQEERKTLNIADLEKVSVDVEIKTHNGTNSEGKEFSYEYILLDEKKYRVPKTVLFQLKQLIEEKPDMTYFKVKKSGEGMSTQYQVFDL